jgi:hypothetical protein
MLPIYLWSDRNVVFCSHIYDLVFQLDLIVFHLFSGKLIKIISKNRVLSVLITICYLDSLLFNPIMAD